jgi:ribosome-associated toxin RatA of RatAB toxin-antitoxin module
MSQLSTQVQIKAPADKLWEVLVDLDSLPQWVPDNARSETASQNSETMPAPRYYDANPFQNTEEYATGWEEGHQYSYEVKNIGPIKSTYNRFSLNPVGEGETVLTQTLDFQMKLDQLGP